MLRVADRNYKISPKRLVFCLNHFVSMCQELIVFFLSERWKAGRSLKPAYNEVSQHIALQRVLSTYL